MSDRTTTHASDIALATWQPTETQRMAKAKFWAQMETSWRAVDSLSLDQITTMAGSTTVKKWMGDPQFQAWFLNQDTAKHKIMAAAEMAIETLTDMLRAPIEKDGVSAAAKVAAATTLLKFSGLEPPKRVDQRNVHGIVSDMDPEQLKTFLTTHMRKMIAAMTPEERDELLGTIAIPGD